MECSLPALRLARFLQSLFEQNLEFLTSLFLSTPRLFVLIWLNHPNCFSHPKSQPRWTGTRPPKVWAIVRPEHTAQHKQWRTQRTRRFIQSLHYYWKGYSVHGNLRTAVYHPARVLICYPPLAPNKCCGALPPPAAIGPDQVVAWMAQRRKLA